MVKVHFSIELSYIKILFFFNLKNNRICKTLRTYCNLFYNATILNSQYVLAIKHKVSTFNKNYTGI